MERDPRRISELLVGLGDVDVLGVVDGDRSGLLVVYVRTCHRPVCPGCGARVRSKGVRPQTLVDLPAFGSEVFLTLRDRLPVFSSRIGGCAVVVVWSC